MVLETSPIADCYAIEDQDVRALLVSPIVDDFRRLQRIFQQYDWDLEQVDHYKGACRFFARDRVPIVIWNPSVTDGSWKDLISQLAPLPQPPRIFIIAQAAEPPLTEEVWQHATGDVLTTPFDAEGVGQRLRSAWLAWRRKSRHGAKSMVARAAG